MARGRIATAICTSLLASSIALTASATPGPGKWRVVAKVPGIVDVVGPRADGRLVLSAHSGLFVMRPAGSPVPYARGAPGVRGFARGAVSDSRERPPGSRRGLR